MDDRALFPALETMLGQVAAELDGARESDALVLRQRLPMTEAVMNPGTSLPSSYSQLVLTVAWPVGPEIGKSTRHLRPCGVYPVVLGRPVEDTVPDGCDQIAVVREIIAQCGFEHPGFVPALSTERI